LNIVFYLIISALLIQRVPLLVSQYKNEGIMIQTVTLQKDNMQPVSFPVKNEKSIVIFWATWCGPCSIELNRINSAILNKEIDPKYVYAVNLEEDPDLVRAHFDKKKYSFKSYFNFNKNLASQLNVSVTPTVAFIDTDKKLSWISSGISPTLIYRIKNFLPDLEIRK
jgi:thiol-disulfide isomerase/thioredoxin